ncbi:MAG TPA: HAMP domain-containing histidine kinase [Candidatus Pelagibacter sp.]|jgi:two-component system sensor histidine kinase ChvG|nr:HAMP domain-containing histidine kinase [Candidatus Pelagibacter sp.]
MRSKFFNTSSILRKFLIFNLIVFLFLSIITFLYLSATKPNLVKKRSSHHEKIIKNTSDHINRLSIKFNKKSAREFLLSTRFLFQNLDRVQLYDLKSNLLADTDTLDLAQNISVTSQDVKETPIDNSSEDVSVNIDQKNNKKGTFNTEQYVRKYSKQKNINNKLVISEKINNNFYVMTIDLVKLKNKKIGYIIVSEISNDILVAVDERKNFILRTVFSVALVILIFSVFLNRYILKPIRDLVLYTKAIKEKDKKIDKHHKYLLRKDEVGLLSRSLNEMTEDLHKRISIAETFSSDLAHEIRNPLTSLKSASEVLENTAEGEKRKKLIKVISHDVERIERLITDYSQMLKDEASLSRAKMSKINLSNVVNSVVEDFNSDLLNSNKNIKIKINNSNLNGFKLNVLGAEGKLEQIIANLLDNAISFSPPNSTISVICDIKKKNAHLIFEDEGPGFNETSINKVFDRFYSNRPEKFGEHSGLGLNIVKNIIELHGGSILASNKSTNKKGARIEVLLPVYK